jgi:aldehyde dehydrogenase (NAD+)
MTTLPEGIKIRNPEKLFIGGQWVEPKAGGRIEVVSPHTEQVCAIVAEAGEADMDAAVAAAREAFDRGPWPRMSPKERGDALRRMAQSLERRHSELGTAHVEQIGALAGFAHGGAPGGTRGFVTFADIADSFEWEAVGPAPTVPGHIAHVVREAVGVVAAIAPWNAPYMIMAQKVAPALIAGCTVIMKPSPETPLEAYIIAEAAEEAGLPPGVVNLVPSHREAADYLVRNPGVDKISFTGSTVAGKRIASVAGERIARVTLELGGKSPAILMDDYPTEDAAKVLARTITFHTGQICATLSRAIVPEHRYDEVADAIAKEMKTVKIGDPHDPETEMGPIAMERQLERVESYVQAGIDEGATLVTGGRRPAHLNNGYYYEPTLFTNVTNDMKIAREEIFGPVLALIKAKDLDDAIEIANDTTYGLNSSVLSNDRQAVYDVGRKLRAGNVGMNGMKADFNLPFGGFKQSGLGREGANVEGLMSFLETKTMLIEVEPAAPEQEVAAAEQAGEAIPG